MSDELFPPVAERKVTGPSVKRGKSKQDYETPPEFTAAVEKRFGPINWDLAATTENTKAPHFFTPRHDSLARSWYYCNGNLWLNPPFDNIAPWAAKCAAHRDHQLAKVFLLTPASIGTNWFRDHVHKKALVLGLNGRLQFVGAPDPYPKDLMLSCFGFEPGFDVWNWRGA